MLGDKDYPPYEWLEDGVPKGLNVDICKELSKVLNREIRVELMQWETAQDKVLNDEADGLIEIEISELSQRSYDLTESTIEFSYGLFVRSSNVTIRKVADVDGKKVGVTAGGYPRTFLGKRPQIQLVIVKNYLEGFQLLTSGEIDALAADMWVAPYLIQEYDIDGITVAGDPFVTVAGALAVKKGNITLLNELNGGIQELKETGILDRVKNDWSVKEIVFFTKERLRNDRITVLLIGLPMGILLICLVIWLLVLRKQIRERRRTEEALRESENKFRSLFEQAGDYILVLEPQPDGPPVIVDANEAAIEKHGFSRDEFIGKPIADLDNEVNRELIAEMVNRLMAGEHIVFETTHTRKDGSVFPVEVSAKLLAVAEGPPLIISIERDITERKQAGDTLRRSEERYRTLVSVMTSVVWHTNAEGEFVEPQQMFGAFTGQAWEEHKGFGWANMIHPDDRNNVRKRWAEAVENQTIYYSDGRMMRANGAYCYFEAVAAPITNDQGDIREWVGMLTDVSERKLAETELAKHRDHLEELVRERTAIIEAQREQVLDASRLKSEFLATMSHELRTPLNSILALSQLMLSRGTGKDSTKDTEFLSVIERNGRNLLNLINDILDLSSVEAGQTRVSPGEFALDGIVERVLTVVRPMAQAKGLRLEVDLADIPTMYSDQERIVQILLNLLGNAVKFTEVGQVAVIASESDGTISLSVADTGIGIGPDVLPHVFDVFRQVDGSNTRKYEGTGLGLAISQQLAELLEGRITATSEVGKGSTFTLRLPVRMADVVQAGGQELPPGAVTETADAGPARSATDRESETKTGAILVVEDNADNLLATVATLENLGYECVTAVNGELAVVAARTHAPALILMDIQLPVMDGLEAARQIKADATLKDIPIVALTAKAMKGDREEILAAGCDDYLSKPINSESLGQVLHKWLN